MGGGVGARALGLSPKPWLGQRLGALPGSGTCCGAHDLLFDPGLGDQAQVGSFVEQNLMSH